MSVADILRWDPESARDVARAADGRAMAASDVSNGLRRLPAFGSWEGGAAEAANAANTVLQLDLHTHHEEATSLGRAATRAADGMEKVQRDLHQLCWDAEDLDMKVEPSNSRILPGPGFLGTAAQLAANVAELESRLTAIQAEAQVVEQEFANAITAASGDSPQPIIQAVDFKQGPPIPEPGTPDDPAGKSGGPNASAIRGVLDKLPRGTSPDIRVVQSPQDLDRLWQWMKQDGVERPGGYGPKPGEMASLPDGTIVGRREAAGSTKLPALDVRVPGPDGYIKVHINPQTGGVPEIPAGPRPPIVEGPPRSPVPVDPPPARGGGPIGGSGGGVIPDNTLPGVVRLPEAGDPDLPVIGDGIPDEPDA